MIEKEINKQVIATMRAIAIDGINNAKGGHMGMAIGAAPISYSIVAKNLNFQVKIPNELIVINLFYRQGMVLCVIIQ